MVFRKPGQVQDGRAQEDRGTFQYSGLVEVKLLEITDSNNLLFSSVRRH